jgi:hypothetical protein
MLYALIFFIGFYCCSSLMRHLPGELGHHSVVTMRFQASATYLVIDYCSVTYMIWYSFVTWRPYIRLFCGAWH